MAMSAHLRRLLGIVVILTVALVFGACGDTFNVLKARQAFQTANGAYGTKNYTEAIEEYEKCLELDPQGDRRVVLPSHFYIGSSHHLIVSASRLDSATRDMRLQNAVEYYEKAIDLVEEGGEFQEELEIYKQYAAEQLAAIYRDNMQDFVNAEKYTVMLIGIEDDKPERYYALGDVYERFHDPDEMPLLDKAIEAFEKPVEMTPDDPLAYRQMAALYNRYGRFDDTMEWLSKARDLNPDDPEGFYLIATHYWDKVYRDPDLSMDDRKNFIGLGLGELEKAREIDAEYVDALVYTGLLLREQAKIEEITGNNRRADQLISEANEYRDRALELKKEQEAQEAMEQPVG
jgi:tetratricopeptide (TPR) repeat protein